MKTNFFFFFDNMYRPHTLLSLFAHGTFILLAMLSLNYIQPPPVTMRISYKPPGILQRMIKDSRAHTNTLLKLKIIRVLWAFVNCVKNKVKCNIFVAVGSH